MVRTIFSPNFDSREGEHPQLIVIHIGEGSQNSIIHEFCNRKTEKSSHYLVNRDGSVIQFVDEMNSAWCNGIVWRPQSRLVRDAYLAGKSINKISISIEAEGWAYQEPTQEYYASVVQLVKDIARRYNIPIDQEHVIPHRFIRADKTCPGRISVGKIIAACTEPIRANPIEVVPNLNRPAWLENLIWRTQNQLGAARSPKWSKVRKLFLMDNPNCAVCDRLGTTFSPNNVHHIIPVHVNSTWELDTDNMITLCKEHHFEFGHLGSWHSWNKTVVEDARLWKSKIDNRP